MKGEPVRGGQGVDVPQLQEKLQETFFPPIAQWVFPCRLKGKKKGRINIPGKHAQPSTLLLFPHFHRRSGIEGGL